MEEKKVMIDVKNLTRKYIVGREEIYALNDMSFQIKKGEFAVILGPSGSGKSTLLNLLGGMDLATAGKITVDGEEITSFGNKELNMYRRKMVGFVFQFYNLLPNLTAKENVNMAMRIANGKKKSDALEKVGLKHRENHFPSELSGGEQQRVSIARAIAKEPKIMLCDEPTGALDSETGKIVLKTLWDTCKSNNQTTIIVTHNSFIAEAADRVIHIKDGKVKNVDINSNPKLIDEVVW